MKVAKIATLCAALIRLRQKRKKKRYWVHPLVGQRLLKGQFHKIYADLCTHPKKCFGYFRMSKSSFDELLNMIRRHVTYKNTNMRMAVGAEERLAVTLRYLATGNSFYSLHYEYSLGATTIREIVQTTCKAIWICLQPVFMAPKIENEWLQIATQFEERTNFPQCIGAIDGKHIRLKKPNESGSLFFNYKSFFSMVLLAVVDADYCFIYIDVGAYGAECDANIFKRSNLYKKMENRELRIPARSTLRGDDKESPMPFVMVADEAFGLTESILRPYPRRKLTISQRVYNYRLTRTRRMVECAFGILSNKWRILHRALDVNPSFCDDIVKACCILHNFVRKRDGIIFEDTLHACSMDNIVALGVRSTLKGNDIREYFTHYFTTTEGCVPWQYEKI